MTNRHRQKYITRLLIGLAFFSCGIGLIYYASIFFSSNNEERILWIFASVVLLNSGLLCLGSAFVHKVKSDLIRKQKIKDQHKKYEFE